MTRTEAERLAVLETEFKHVSLGMDELKKTNEELVAGMAELNRTISAWDNKFKGGKAMLAVMLSAAGTVGGVVTWFMTHFPFWSVPLPK